MNLISAAHPAAAAGISIGQAGVGMAKVAYDLHKSGQKPSKGTVLSIAANGLAGAANVPGIEQAVGAQVGMAGAISDVHSVAVDGLAGHGGGGHRSGNSHVADTMRQAQQSANVAPMAQMAGGAGPAGGAGIEMTHRFDFDDDEDLDLLEEYDEELLDLDDDI